MNGGARKSFSSARHGVPSPRFYTVLFSGSARLTAKGFLATLGAIAVSTALCRLMYPYFQLANLIMVYLLAVVWVACSFSYMEAAVASFLSVAAFDFFFVNPRHTFAVADTRDILTFGIMLAVALLISTLTLRIRAQAGMISDRERRAESEKTRSTLLSSISHDLRTPLAAIAGSASALVENRTLSEANRNELAQTIWDEAEHLSATVRNVLDLTRLENDHLQIKREWQSLEELIGAAVSRTSELLGSRDIGIELPSDLPLLYLDGVLIEQLLVNLLENAARHTPPDSRVLISAAPCPEGVQLRIEDNGPGLSRGEEELVFEKLYRGGSGNSRGFGLGLSICRAIMRLHGGSIGAFNSASGGASFRLIFPRNEEMPQVNYDG